MTSVCRGSSIFTGKLSELLLTKKNIDIINNSFISRMKFLYGYKFPEQRKEYIIGLVEDTLYDLLYKENRLFFGEVGSRIREVTSGKDLLRTRAKKTIIKKAPEDIKFVINNKVLNTMIEQAISNISAINRYEKEKHMSYGERVVKARTRPVYALRPEKIRYQNPVRVYGIPYPYDN